MQRSKGHGSFVIQIMSYYQHIFLCSKFFFQILYSRIGIALWKSSRGLERHIAMQNTTTSHMNTGNGLVTRANSRYENKRCLGATESQVSYCFVLIKFGHIMKRVWDCRNIDMIQCTKALF